ncbi:MAG TPA: LemA family protein, partial [Thermoanaerobaculia bacterium]
MGNKVVLGCLAAVLVVVLFTGMWAAGSYNKLNASEQAVNAGWAQVENVYQRRADLIPNLVETVKGAASFEKST